LLLTLLLSVSLWIGAPAGSAQDFGPARPLQSGPGTFATGDPRAAWHRLVPRSRCIARARPEGHPLAEAVRGRNRRQLLRTRRRRIFVRPSFLRRMPTRNNALPDSVDTTL